jgi:indole-3-glycerol phosphate synthase
VETKRDEVRVLDEQRSRLLASAEEAPPARDFWNALGRPGSVALIAEVKRRSPGAGEIRSDLDPVALARSYEAGGASALSVLTDRVYFGGSLDDLAAVKRAVSIPVLRKDFLIDPLQVAEARGAGADAVLLIVRVLEPERLADLARATAEAGMDALVEVHDRAELDVALSVGATLVGINSRDLATFDTDLRRVEALAADVPEAVTLVGESGIRNAADVDRLGAAGVDAVLVGTSLMRAASPARALRELLGRPLAARARPARAGKGA